ncbi:aminotransferase class V-fold PLP-dependent enzyme [Rhizobium cauense]|uniref:aminotransferase class V-fold PLP-dependent enzyme n=1 Tax=Rhizobium cauense TaxID=1166683 RepID=UPI001C6EAEA8|nr:aminotransferase class V-fold PLP-dependent enzyme [Rhizobium cauense]
MDQFSLRVHVLGRAIDYALELGLENIEGRCKALSTEMRDGLRDCPGVTVHDLGPNPASIVSFTISNHPGSDVKAKLTELGFNVSVSAPSSTLLDASARQLPPVVRASPHYYNSEEEIDRFLDAVRTLSKA